jgi:hypothetical protein
MGDRVLSRWRLGFVPSAESIWENHLKNNLSKPARARLVFGSFAESFYFSCHRSGLTI